MIKDIIELLRTDDFIKSSEAIQIAKGKYKTPQTFKESITYIKRRINGRND
jgi:hypothetical protein